MIAYRLSVFVLPSQIVSVNQTEYEQRCSCLPEWPISLPTTNKRIWKKNLNCRRDNRRSSRHARLSDSKAAKHRQEKGRVSE